MKVVAEHDDNFNTLLTRVNCVQCPHATINGSSRQ